MTEVTIKFDNEKAAEHFVTFFCEQGEQDYWNWMEYRESEEDGNITALRFRYQGNVITAECGRLDKCE